MPTAVDDGGDDVATVALEQLTQFPGDDHHRRQLLGHDGTAVEQGRREVVHGTLGPEEEVRDSLE